jgi:hypothetical protein
MKKNFALTLNSAARSLLFSNSQTALRIQRDGALAIKSGINPNAKDAIGVEVPEKGALVANITGTDAGNLAKAFKKLGYEKSPYFTLNRGTGGWYELQNVEATKMPGVACVKVEIPDNVDEIVAAASVVKKRGPKPGSKRAPKAAKTAKKTGKKTKIEASEFQDEDFQGYERRLFDAATIIAASTGQAGRPSSELVAAKATLLRAETLFNKFMGGTSLNVIAEKMTEGLKLISESFELISAVAAHQENLSIIANSIVESEIQQEAAQSEITQEIGDEEAEAAAAQWLKPTAEDGATTGETTDGGESMEISETVDETEVKEPEAETAKSSPSRSRSNRRIPEAA